MNIFAVHPDPRVSAQMLCDKHVVKMPLESAQMLCTALDRHGVQLPYIADGGWAYRPCYQKHPCTLWAGDTRANYKWLTHHALEMCEEYTRRYSKRGKWQSVIERAAEMADLIPDGRLTTHATAMPEEAKDSRCPHRSYRSYYRQHKGDIATWKHTQTPRWFWRTT